MWNKLRAVPVSRGQRQRAHWPYWLCLSLSFLLSLLPLWSVPYVGMVDYHNHLARTHIIDQYGINALFRERFIVSLEPIPNVAMDLIVLGLAKVMSIETAGRVFLTLLAALWAVGWHSAGRAVLGKNNWMAVLAALLLYNSPFLYGFVNYVFSIALFACAFAFWFRARRRLDFPRTALCALLSLAAFLCHLVGFALLVTTAGIVSLLERREKRLTSAIRETWMLASPIPFALVFMGGSGRVGDIVWNSLKGKAVAFLPFFTYDYRLDAIVLVVMALSLFVTFRRSRAVSSTFLAALVLFAIFLVSPLQLLTSSAADARIALPAWLLALISFEVRWSRVAKVAFAVAASMLLVRHVHITRHWQQSSRDIAAVAALGQRIPTGATVYPVVFPLQKGSVALTHANSYWTISRDVFLPSLFAVRGQAPLNFREMPCYRAPSSDGAWLRCLAQYEYAFTLGASGPYTAALAEVAVPLARHGEGTLWRVRRAVSETPDSARRRGPKAL